MSFYFRQDHYRVDKNWLPSIEGYACLFNTGVAVDGKTLSFSRGAFALELARRTDVVACVKHVRGEAFASVRDGSLKLWEDETGLAFSASIPRGQKYIFLPDAVAEGTMGASIGFWSVSETEDSKDRLIKSVNLVHVALTRTPAFPTGAWLSNFSLMGSAPPHLKELRQKWLAGQRPPPSDISHKYRCSSSYPFLIWPGDL